MNKKWLALILAGFIGVSFLLYWNSIPGHFVYDDRLYISDRPELREAPHLLKLWVEPFRPGDPNAEVYRPLTVFSFALNFQVFGESPVSFHVANILLNGIAAFLVFLVVLKLFENRFLAFSTALLFIFFPIHTETIANIKSRDNILSAIFILFSFLVFLKAIGREKINSKLLVFSSLYFFLALLSMEFAIAAPAIFLAVYWIRNKPSLSDLLRAGTIFIPATATYFLIRWLILRDFAFGQEEAFWYYAPMNFVGFGEKIFTAFKILFLYVQKTFIPFNLSATHHYNHLPMVVNPFTDFEVIAGAGLLVILAIFVFYRKLRQTPLGYGAAIFFVSYLIFSKFIITSGDIFAERWMYLPSAGLALIGGFVIHKIYSRQKWAAIMLLAAILTSYAFILIPRNRIWLTEKNLYESMIKDAPDSAQGYIGLVYLYAKEDDGVNAEKYLKLGQEIYRDHPRLLNMAAIFALSKRDFETAKSSISRSIEILPNVTNYLLYAVILTEEGEYEKSLSIAESYFKTPFFNPKDPMTNAVRYIAGMNLQKLGRPEEAQKYLEGLPALQPLNILNE